MKSLQESVLRFIEAAGGSWGIVIEDVERQSYWEHNQTRPFVAESIIKIPIMAAAFAAADKQVFRLSEMVTVYREDLVGGSGILQHLSPGIQLSIYDLITLMIIQSDNTATNVLIDLIGVEQIKQTMNDLGMNDSSYQRKLMVYPVDTPEKNMITAKDVALLLKKLSKGEYLSRHACQQMIEIMKKQQIRNALPAYLPYSDTNFLGVQEKWELAHKTGWNIGSQHDAGILYVNGRVITITVLSRDVDPFVSKDTQAKIGKEVFQYAHR